MRTEDIDRLWSQALHEAVAAGEPFTRYRFAALVAAAEREACARAVSECFIGDRARRAAERAIRARQ